MTKIPDINLNQNLWALVFSLVALGLGEYFQLEKFDGHKHVDIVFERPKLHIEVNGIQHNQSTRQALSDLKRTFYSMQDCFLTIRIPNVLVKNELTETVNYLVEFILERYYKHM